MLKCSTVVPINSLPFPLIDITLRLELHRQRDHIVIRPAVILRPDDLLPAHRTLWDALSGLGALVLARDEGFHKTGVAEEVAAVGGCQVFHIFHADDALQRGELDGFVGLFLLRLDGGHALLLEDF